MVDLDMDMSRVWRSVAPALFGMFPSRSAGERHTARRGALVFLGDAMHIGAHLACRLTALSVAMTLTLFSASASTAPAPNPVLRWLVPAWLAAEFLPVERSPSTPEH